MKYKILFVLLVIMLIFGLQIFNCLDLEFSEIPKKFFYNKSAYILVLLYGTGICESCPTGRYLTSIKDNPGVLFIVPDNFSDIDIENFRTVFMVRGEIIRGDGDVVKYLKKIAKCKKLKPWEKNFIIQLDKKKAIASIRTI